MTTLHRYNHVQFAEFKEKNFIKKYIVQVGIQKRNVEIYNTVYIVYFFIIAKERQISLRYFYL